MKYQRLNITGSFFTHLFLQPRGFLCDILGRQIREFLMNSDVKDIMILFTNYLNNNKRIGCR